MPTVMMMITMTRITEVLMLVGRARNDCNWFASPSFFPSQGHPTLLRIGLVDFHDEDNEYNENNDINYKIGNPQIFKS